MPRSPVPTLLSPLTVANLTLRNRIVMPPIWSGRAAPDGSASDGNVAFHAERAEAGCGLVIVEHSFVHPGGRHSATQLGVHRDEMIPGHACIAGAIRDAGAVACLQLAHAGSKGTAAVLGHPPVAPSAVPHAHRDDDELPEALSSARIAEIVTAFGDAAARAREAGYQAVEIHAAHGFLLSQFLSPLANRRDDHYGGDERSRAHLHLEVIAEVRDRVGADLAVFMRLGACDETPGGLEIGTTSRIAPDLVAAGLDLLDVSGGMQGSRPEGREPGYFVPYAEALRGVVPVPVLVAGGVREPAFADQLVRDERVDLVGVARAMLEDPGWAARAIEALS